jgi:hypothetical protein
MKDWRERTRQKELDGDSFRDRSADERIGRARGQEPKSLPQGATNPRACDVQACFLIPVLARALSLSR